MTLMLLLLNLVAPSPPLPLVDMAEVNTFGGNGLCQIVLWDWSYEHDCFVVVAWRMVCTDEQVEAELSNVKYKHFRETWTFHDPEVANRVIVPTHERRKLRWISP